MWKAQYPDCNFYATDADTYADKFMQEYKNNWLKNNGIKHFVLDLHAKNAYNKLSDFVKKNNIDAIVSYASESHVDNSIKNPNIFFESNVLGFVNVLNVAKDYKLRVVYVGTDEILGETSPEDWEEWDYMGIENPPLRPSSPYSSSKASAELIAFSYYRTFDVDVVTTRCTNNFGKFQECEKLIGTVISKALNDEKIPVYGKGNQKRHWIHVDEHNKAIMNILENGLSGSFYNIAPNPKNYISNIILVKFILKYLNKSTSLIEHVKDRLGHDTTYFLKPTSEFSYSNKLWKSDMRKTIDWYVENLA